MVLVTGGTGFIGGHLIDRLRTAGTPVRALVRWRKTPPILPEGTEVVTGDLATGEGLEKALEGVDTVYHVAGVIRALTPDGYYAGNAHASEKLARATAGRGIRFVHVSSLAAAGPSADGAPVTEDAEPRPVSHYGRSKLEGERRVLRAIPDATIIRPPVVYGPRDTGVLQILKSIARGWMLEIGGGDRWFSSIYVADLVDGLLAAAASAQTMGRTYFLTAPKPATWRDLKDAASRVIGRKARMLSVPLPIAHVVGWGADVWSQITREPGIISRDKIAEAQCRWWTCSPHRATTDFGFEAGTSLERGLEITLAWYKEAGWLKF